MDWSGLWLACPRVFGCCTRPAGSSRVHGSLHVSLVVFARPSWSSWSGDPLVTGGPRVTVSVVGCLGIGEPKLIAPVFERMARGVFVFRDEKMESCCCGSLGGFFDGELWLVMTFRSERTPVDRTSVASGLTSALL